MWHNFFAILVSFVFVFFFFCDFWLSFHDRQKKKSRRNKVDAKHLIYWRNIETSNAKSFWCCLIKRWSCPWSTTGVVLKKFTKRGCLNSHTEARHYCNRATVVKLKKKTRNKRDFLKMAKLIPSSKNLSAKRKTFSQNVLATRYSEPKPRWS